MPDDTKIPVITGRVVEIAADIENDEDIPIRKYDKVLLKPGNAIPVEMDDGNKLFVLQIHDIVAIFRKSDDKSYEEDDA